MSVTVAMQSDVRTRLKYYLDLASEGNAVMIPRVGNKNVVIISEEEYQRSKRLQEYSDRITELTDQK